MSKQNKYAVESLAINELNVVNKDEFIRLTKDVDFTLNIGKSEEDLKKGQKSKTLSLKMAKGNYNPVELAKVNGKIGCVRGNIRIFAVQNSPCIVSDEDIKALTSKEYDTIDTKDGKKEHHVNLDDCQFKIVYLGELDEKEFHLRNTLDNQVQKIDKKGWYNDIKRHVKCDPTITEIRLRMALDCSKGKIQEHFKVVKMSVQYPRIEELWLNGKAKRSHVNDFYTQFIKETPDKKEMEKILNMAEKEIEKPKAKSAEDIQKMAKALPVELLPLFDYILGKEEKINVDYVEFFAKAKEAGIILK